MAVALLSWRIGDGDIRAAEHAFGVQDAWPRVLVAGERVACQLFLTKLPKFKAAMNGG
jgi:hypothetical protein